MSNMTETTRVSRIFYYWVRYHLSAIIVKSSQTSKLRRQTQNCTGRRRPTATYRPRIIHAKVSSLLCLSWQQSTKMSSKFNIVTVCKRFAIHNHQVTHDKFNICFSELQSTRIPTGTAYSTFDSMISFSGWIPKTWQRENDEYWWKINAI